MAITVFPITEAFAAEIGDIDLASALSPEDVDAVKRAFWTYAVLVFPDQKLEAEQHLEFAKQFGPLEISMGVYGDGPMRTRAEIADVSNFNHKNEIWRSESRLRMFQMGNRLWHTDSSFKHVPALCSLIRARSSGSPSSPKRSARTCRRFRRCWSARFPSRAASRSISPRMPDASGASATRREGRCSTS
jgi:alpha-ketoglutarate-dependent 2,4-dichlorophenoxyacetate dioxygenase